MQHMPPFWDLDAPYDPPGPNNHWPVQHPYRSRGELIKLAEQFGMDTDETQNIDVVAGLIYEGITQLLIRVRSCSRWAV